MAAEVMRTLEAELSSRRRVLRDAPAPVDKVRVLAHLRTQLEQLQQSEEAVHGDA